MKVYLSVYSDRTGEKTTRVDEIKESEINGKVYPENEIVEYVELSPEEFAKGILSYKHTGSLNANLVEDRCVINTGDAKHIANLNDNMLNAKKKGQSWRKNVAVVRKNIKVKSKIIKTLGVLDLTSGKMKINYNSRYKTIRPLTKDYFYAVVDSNTSIHQAIIALDGIEIERLSDNYSINNGSASRLEEIDAKSFTPYDKLYVSKENISVEELKYRFEKTFEKVKSEYEVAEQIQEILPTREHLERE